MEKGKDKVKKICDILRRDTLEPAKKEAEEIISAARLEAERIVEEAKRAAHRIEIATHQDVERQMQVLRASLFQASRQVIESLKQQIENRLFMPGLSKLITREMRDPQVIARLVQAIVQAVHQEGIDANLSIYIPAVVPAQEVNALLAQHILADLKEKSVLLGAFGGGIEVKMHQENVTIDISSEAIKEMVAGYIRKDFREFVFSKET